MSSGNAVGHFSPGTLVVTPGDREDIILAALSTNSGSGQKGGPAGGNGCQPAVAGLVLAGDLRPHESILETIRNSDVPVITAALDSYDVARRIHSMTVKTLPGDTEKIGTIQDIVGRYVEVDRLLEKLG